MIFESQATLPHLFSAHLFLFWLLRMAALIVEDSFYLRWLQTADPRIVGFLGVGKQILSFTHMKQERIVQLKFYCNTILDGKIRFA